MTTPAKVRLSLEDLKVASFRTTGLDAADEGAVAFIDFDSSSCVTCCTDATTLTCTECTCCTSCTGPTITN